MVVMVVVVGGTDCGGVVDRGCGGGGSGDSDYIVIYKDDVCAKNGEQIILTWK